MELFSSAKQIKTKMPNIISEEVMWLPLSILKKKQQQLQASINPLSMVFHLNHGLVNVDLVSRTNLTSLARSRSPHPFVFSSNVSWRPPTSPTRCTCPTPATSTNSSLSATRVDSPSRYGCSPSRASGIDVWKSVAERWFVMQTMSRMALWLIFHQPDAVCCSIHRLHIGPPKMGAIQQLISKYQASGRAILFLLLFQRHILLLQETSMTDYVDPSDST